jgi:glutathione peroxidase
MVSLFSELSRCGFQILAFPCNQFGAQEPGTNAEIAQFAKKQVVMLKTTTGCSLL